MENGEVREQKNLKRFWGKMGVRVGRVALEKVWWPPVLLFFYFVVAICIVVLPLARIYLLSSKQDNEILLNS